MLEMDIELDLHTLQSAANPTVNGNHLNQGDHTQDIAPNNTPRRVRNVKKPITLSAQRTAQVRLPCDVNKRNLFVKLGLFFSEPQNSLKVVQQLLEDHLDRGLTTIDKLVTQIDEYCQQFQNTAHNNCRSFIYASFIVITWCGGDVITAPSRDVAGRLDYLLKHHSSSLCTLLTLICKSEFCSFAIFIDAFQDAFKTKALVPKLQRERVLRHLDAFLNACAKLHVCHTEGVRFVDMTLGFGETPLIAATRARRDDTIALLLRYGARSEHKWLGYETCLEVLLFTPCMSYIDDQQLADIELCLPLIATSTDSINMKRLIELSKDYHAVTDSWQELLAAYACTDGPATLKHSCRLRIRQALHDNWVLPNGLHTLPLPKPIHAYLDVEHS